jgi:hypothetical protein
MIGGSMDCATIQRHLALAELHVARGDIILARQRALVALEEAMGGDVQPSVYTFAIAIT